MRLVSCGFSDASPFFKEPPSFIIGFPSAGAFLAKSAHRLQCSLSDAESRSVSGTHLHPILSGTLSLSVPAAFKESSCLGAWANSN